MLDIKAARDSFLDQVIFDIRFIGSSQNLAERRTKRMTQASLQELITKGRLDPARDQWINRK